MTVQLTKEWLQQEIMRLEAGLDREDAYRTDDDGQRTLAAFRLALVSIDNEPVEESGIFIPAMLLEFSILAIKPALTTWLLGLLRGRTCQTACTGYTCIPQSRKRLSCTITMN